MRIFLLLIILIVYLSAEKKVALLIGNQDYANYPKLHTPINDIRAMENLLRKKGFHTIVLVNATQEKMQQRLDYFRTHLKYTNIALVYYSGHGVALNNKNYLIPVDAPKIKNKRSHYKLTSLDKIMNISSTAKASIIIINACRPISNSKNFNKGLVPIHPKRDSIVSFSASVGKTASDKNFKYSLFGQALLKNLKKKKEIIVALQNVKTDVMIKSDYQQIPYIFENLRFKKLSLTKNRYFITNNYCLSSMGISDEHNNITEHSYIIIKMINEVKKLKNIKTYVLFPNNLTSFIYKDSKEYKRYKRVLQLIQKNPKYTLHEINSKKNAKDINQFILFGKENFIESEKLTLNDYNYKLSNKIQTILQKKAKRISFKGEGPFLVTTMNNIITDKNITYLYIDLSEFNNSAIDEIINSYKQHLIDKGNSDFTTLEKLKYKILALLTNANDNIHIVKSAVAGGIE
jgi:hypothetical protein